MTTNTSCTILQLLLSVTIEPGHLQQLQLEHGPGGDCQSHLVEEYIGRRSDPLLEITSPDGHENMTFNNLKAEKQGQLTCVSLCLLLIIDN